VGLALRGGFAVFLPLDQHHRQPLTVGRPGAAARRPASGWT
jgi:hypothetical protein